MRTLTQFPTTSSTIPRIVTGLIRTRQYKKLDHLKIDLLQMRPSCAHHESPGISGTLSMRTLTQFPTNSSTGEIGSRLLQHVNQVDQLEKEASTVTVINNTPQVNYTPYVVVAVAALLFLKLR